MEPTPRPTLESVTTIRDDGSRRFLYPADARGIFTLGRRLSGLFLIAFYLSLPWIKVGGYPSVFLDVANRRFHLFGFTLTAQDAWLLFFLITGLGFLLFFLTALVGRVWCGWACPQTVFLDHLYRPIERWIDGDAVSRRALAAAPWTKGKVARRAAKHGLFILVSAVITHLFLAYYVSLPEVWAMMRAAPGENWSAFAFIAVATGALYFNYAWFREQLCIIICPYGRLQSALQDDHSMIIGYDTGRGEPRATVAEAKAHAAGATSGDCVACSRCVSVCPTGIDIRNGLQIECIGCAACIDACDEVMERLHRPKGLIRYDSLNGFAGRKTRWFRPRTAVYTVLLLAGISVATWAFSTLRPANFGVTRMTGAPYIVDAQFVRNQFLARIVNKRTEPQRFVVSATQGPGELRQTGFSGVVEVAPLGEIVEPLILQMPRLKYQGPFQVSIGVRDEAGKFHLERQVEFLGPDARLLREEEAEEAHGPR
jgi:cytochrome c oxidase accessory protein FixG